MRRSLSWASGFRLITRVVDGKSTELRWVSPTFRTYPPQVEVPFYNASLMVREALFLLNVHVFLAVCPPLLLGSSIYGNLNTIIRSP